MFDVSDTIVAIATPPGRGGIGIVRLSGPDARRVAGMMTKRSAQFEPRRATLSRIADGTRDIDRVLITSFPAPHSYTGQDVVEISAHGSPVLLQQIVASATAAGARLAAPGEFTFRAFLNGRIDLIQAEAVRDLIEAVTPAQARAAFDQLEGTLTDRIAAIDRNLFDVTTRLEASLDFPVEGYHFIDSRSTEAELDVIVHDLDAILRDAERGRLIRDGLHVVIAGRPNTGKSSLFNRLAGAGRAIVTDIPGTTRDLLTEVIDIHGIPVTVVDTAGIRERPSDSIEAEGIARAARAWRVAAVTLIVLDRSRPVTADDRRLLELTAAVPRLLVANKCDLPREWEPATFDTEIIEVSATTGLGEDALREGIIRVMDGTSVDRDVPAITNTRHVQLLTDARTALRRACDAARAGVSEEYVLADIHDARALLEEVTGHRTPDAVVDAIFDRFCIGK